ncbi:putative inactive 1-aminocyclopropane-1-carboxylate synthase-like protein 2 [Rhynchocyon petersi]
MSQAKSLPVPRGQMNQELRGELLKKVLQLQQTLEKNILKLMVEVKEYGLSLAKQLEDLEQRCNQAINKQEMAYLINQMVSLLKSDFQRDQGYQLSPSSMDTRSDARGGLEEELEQNMSQLSEPFITFVGHGLSNRGEKLFLSYHSGFQDYIAFQADKYHEATNILGLINLGTSENKLCTDLMIERLSQPDMNYIDDALLQYPDWKGQLFLREEVARFLTYYCNAPAPLDPENVVVLNGCSSVFLALTMALCDGGEAFLIPTPFYSGLAFTARMYANVELLHVHLDSKITGESEQPFQLTVEKLEEGLREATSTGKKIRGLVLTNPHDPLGDVYSKDSLKKYLEFAKRHNLHVIIDEIYMLSVFDKATTFHSVLSLESLPDPQKTHMIWGTSKDFGISGFRFGILYTHSKDVAGAVSTFGYLHGISSITQYKLQQLLKDKVPIVIIEKLVFNQAIDWIDKMYLPVYHSRLEAAHKLVTEELDALAIPYLKRGSGLCLWINLKEYLKPCTFDSELSLHRYFLDNKLMLSHGKSYMCKEPGWFRLVFTERTKVMKLAMSRFSEALNEYRDMTVRELLRECLEELPEHP